MEYREGRGTIFLGREVKNRVLDLVVIYIIEDFMYCKEFLYILYCLDFIVRR